MTFVYFCYRIPSVEILACNVPDRQIPGPARGNFPWEKEGEGMSLEAIKQVAEAEEATKLRKTEAAAAAKQLVAEAEKAGKRVLASARAEAEAQVKTLIAQAGERAERDTAEAAAQTEAECAALRKAAEVKLEEAAALIVRRVVNS